MFVDRVEVKIKAGDGGDGKLSFRHEKFQAMGGPDGGDGGDGGDVVLVASRNQNTLANYRYKKIIKASDGKPGDQFRKHGRSAEDLELKVPIGTVAVDKNGNVMADLVEDGQTEVIAMGGKGGYGNAHFVSSVRQAPRVAEKGEAGEEYEVTLELKMIADVGIVGLPNAGKSTLLSVVSNAKPEIANYPFTTLRPNLGVVDIDKKRSVLFADIPGLIEGASMGKGLGDEFLRHIERTKVLIHLVDVYNEDLEKAYKTIIKELAEYQIDLSKRLQVVALTKTEGLSKKDLEHEIKRLKKLAPRGTPILAISSASGQNVQDLLRTIDKMLEKANKVIAKVEKKSTLPIISFKPAEDDWLIEKTDSGFVVTGRKVERFANRTRFGDYHGEQRMRDVLKKMGVIRELERKGIEPDQKIYIGNPTIGSLEY
jgi:GTPase